MMDIISKSAKTKLLIIFSILFLGLVAIGVFSQLSGGISIVGLSVSSDSSGKPPVGSLSVSSDPSDVSIYLDGIFKGYTPKIIKNLQTGNHSLLLKKEGYLDWRQIVYIAPKETTKVYVKLILDLTKRSVIEGIINPDRPDIITEDKYYWAMINAPEIDLSDMPTVQVFVKPIATANRYPPNTFAYATEVPYGDLPKGNTAFENGKVWILFRWKSGGDDRIFFTDYKIVIIK